MARVKGREVVVDLMDAVAALEKTTALHATQLRDVAALAVETSARVHGLTGQTSSLMKGFSDLSRRMDDLSRRMDDMSQRMDDMSQRMNELTTGLGEVEAGLNVQAENLLVAAKTVHQQQEQFARVGRLLATFAASNGDRFDELDARLTVLEKKAS